jgi:hypothetical protein
VFEILTEGKYFLCETNTFLILHSDQRTNNVMECYNKNFSKALEVHPSLVKFCNDLEMEAKRAWLNVEDARAGRVTQGKKRKEEIEWPVVPDEFVEFVEEMERKAEEKQKKKICGKKKCRICGLCGLLCLKVCSMLFYGLCWNGGSKILSVIHVNIGIKLLWIIWESGSTWIKFNLCREFQRAKEAFERAAIIHQSNSIKQANHLEQCLSGIVKADEGIASPHWPI